jgi:hypothetical protein
MLHKSVCIETSKGKYVLFEHEPVDVKIEGEIKAIKTL